MSADFIAVSDKFTVQEAIDWIRTHPQAPGRPAYVYVTDQAHRLLGVLYMRDLIFSAPTQKLQELIQPGVISVPVLMDQEEVIKLFHKKNLMALPVVDQAQRLVGMITASDISHIVEEEATEDMLKIAGISGGEESFKMPIRVSVRRRLPWLVTNIFLDVMAVSVIACFESTLQEVIALAVILPIISDMGGNVGIQTIAIAVRELATGEISFNDFGKIVVREIGVGLINGVMLGLILCGVGYLWKGNIYLGIIAGTALCINTIIAGITGTALPLLLKKRGVDPATASGSLLTTVTDVCGFFLTLSLAAKFLPLLK